MSWTTIAQSTFHVILGLQATSQNTHRKTKTNSSIVRVDNFFYISPRCQADGWLCWQLDSTWNQWPWQTSLWTQLWGAVHIAESGGVIPHSDWILSFINGDRAVSSSMQSLLSASPWSKSSDQQLHALAAFPTGWTEYHRLWARVNPCSLKWLLLKYLIIATGHIKTQRNFCFSS